MSDTHPARETRGSRGPGSPQHAKVDDLLTALAHSKPGQTMTLTLNRNGSTLTVHVHLGELPASA